MRFKKMGILFMAGLALTLAGCSAMSGASEETSTYIQIVGLDELGEVPEHGVHLHKWLSLFTE